MNNTAILCFILGWQGGTVHQVSEVLGLSVSTILDANTSEMELLCRKAQTARYHSAQRSPAAKLRPAQIEEIIRNNVREVTGSEWQGKLFNADDIPQAARAIHRAIYEGTE